VGGPGTGSAARSGGSAARIDVTASLRRDGSTNDAIGPGLNADYDRVGGQAQARSDLARAERAFTQLLAILEELAALDPTNTGWQRDLATGEIVVSANQARPSKPDRHYDAPGSASLMLPARHFRVDLGLLAGDLVEASEIRPHRNDQCGARCVGS